MKFKYLLLTFLFTLSLIPAVFADMNNSPVNRAASVPVTAFYDVRTAELSPVFQGSFEYTVDNTALTINTKVNGCTITQASAMAVVSSSTTTASTCRMDSFRLSKYRAGLGALVRFTGLFTACTAGTEQFIGMLGDGGSSESFDNGLAVGCEGATFGFHRFVNDALVTVAQADWNIDTLLDLDGDGAGDGRSGMILDITKLNVFAIEYEYLGAGAITLKIEDDSTGMLIPVHTIYYTNQNIVPHSFDPNYHWTMWVNNGGTTKNVTVKSASYGFFVEGHVEPMMAHQPQFSTGIIETTTVTGEVALFTIRIKAEYQSKANHIEVLPEFIVASIEAANANNLASLRLVRNVTFTGTSPSYSDINTANSVVEIDTSADTISGGIDVFPIFLSGKNDDSGGAGNLTPYKILLLHGDTLTLTGVSANSATINSYLLWKELF